MSIAVDVELFFRRGRGVNQQPGRLERKNPQRRLSHPPLAIFEGTFRKPECPWVVHTLARPKQGRVQNRGFRPGRSTLGQTQEPTCDELRQTQQEHTPILQERYHEKNRAKSEIGVPILSPLLFLIQHSVCTSKKKAKHFCTKTDEKDKPFVLYKTHLHQTHDHRLYIVIVACSLRKSLVRRLGEKKNPLRLRVTLTGVVPKHSGNKSTPIWATIFFNVKCCWCLCRCRDGVCKRAPLTFCVTSRIWYRGSEGAANQKTENKTAQFFSSSCDMLTGTRCELRVLFATTFARGTIRCSTVEDNNFPFH